jgi:dienelactone hydrolase
VGSSHREAGDYHGTVVIGDGERPVRPLDAAREIVETAGSDLAELYVYPGDQHLFTDSSLPAYDEEAAALVVKRSREFLDRLG